MHLQGVYFGYVVIISLSDFVSAREKKDKIVSCLCARFSLQWVLSLNTVVVECCRAFKAGLLAFDSPRCFVGLSRASSGSDARVGLSDVFYSSNFDVVFKACPNLPPAVRHGFRVVGCLTTRSRFVLTMLRCHVCVRGRRLWVALFTRAVSHSRWLYISPVKR